MRNTQQRSALSSGGVLNGPPRFLHPSSKQGQKRRFLLAGVANVGLTNALLQLLLVSPVVSVGLATLLSQFFNGIFGFAIYGKIVFNVRGMRSDCSGLRYLALMGLMWLCNWFGIELLKAANFSASASGLLMIAPLAGISYIIQKNWVFRRP